CARLLFSLVLVEIDRDCPVVSTGGKTEECVTGGVFMGIRLENIYGYYFRQDLIFALVKVSLIFGGTVQMCRLSMDGIFDDIIKFGSDSGVKCVVLMKFTEDLYLSSL
ncbi:unnamed protein product, partial [Rotaria magnacalcarata]